MLYGTDHSRIAIRGPSDAPGRGPSPASRAPRALFKQVDGGGGGGYSGGGGGANQGDGGGGGGSYVDANLDTSLCTAAEGGYRSGDGLVEIPPVAGLVLAASSDDQGGPDGIFEITLQETRTGDFAEARVVDQETGWRAEVMFWHDQEAVRFAVRLRNSSGPNNDFTAFGFFPQGKPEEIQYLALKTSDLKMLGIKPNVNASNQAKYQAFQRLMNSATWEELGNSWGEGLEIDLLILWSQLTPLFNPAYNIQQPASIADQPNSISDSPTD